MTRPPFPFASAMAAPPYPALDRVAPSKELSR